MLQTVTGEHEMQTVTADDIVGYLDCVGSMEISGWGYQRSRPDESLAIKITIDDDFVIRADANEYRPDVLSAGHGRTNVGFRILVPEQFRDGGRHRVTFVSDDNCLLAFCDPKTGASSHSWLLSSSGVPIPAQEPVSGFVIHIDAVSKDGIAGWVHSDNAILLPTTLSIYIDGEPAGNVACDKVHDDVAPSNYPDRLVEFSVLLPSAYQDGDLHRLEFRDPTGETLKLATDTGETSELVFRLEADKASPVVHMDEVSEDQISGWAYSEVAIFEPVTLVLYIDGDRVDEVLCDTSRPDVKNSGHPSAAVGFAIPIPPRYFDDAPHVLQFQSVDGEPVRLVHGEHTPALTTFQFPSTTIVGQVDGLLDGAIRGWVLSHDRKTGDKHGGLQVLVTIHDQPVAHLLANQFRPDVGEEWKCDPNCGFMFVPPANLFAGKSVVLNFKVIPGQIELRNSPYNVAFPDLHAYQGLQKLLESADHLFTELWSLRAKIRGLLPADSFNLLTYDAWANTYYDHLKNSEVTPPVPESKQLAPLISIICPTYRPRIKDFMAAVESVIAQTHENWELIIVDDASGSAELESCIKGYSARDSRIRPKFKQKNGGISAATNTALKMARGTYIALFDHDDLMVEHAMEVMLEAALRTGAKMLYCDEDKIDDNGEYSEVNFKPDWNYRLLLAQNYVCHILFVERAHLRKVGPLRSEYDGAQDHDLILRLAEITPVEQIHHVSEVLYHWRKTPFSTATSGKSKAYAVAAGRRAVADHLARQGISDVQVISPLESTLYEVIWHPPQDSKVTIIIPYREHIQMTTECVAAIRSVTEYTNYDIVLIDNWSTSDEALAFAESAAQNYGAKVIRVEESFNYSRLNNLAVSTTESEFLLFMNNDVIVSDSRWLTQMIGEAVADARVGIVGNKLLYPNKLVQHGGIILGVGGVADHAHRGLSRDAPGYMGRAISSQDLSAVTAACLLCRRSVFNEVGGFDEEQLKVAFNDVDLCLKVGAAGYRIVWSAASTAEHRESLSRGSDFRPENQGRFFHENEVMMQRWHHIISKDPHYNYHFSSRCGIFSDLGPPVRTISASVRPPQVRMALSNS
jgi:GT2 family glycosyltransferase